MEEIIIIETIKETSNLITIEVEIRIKQVLINNFRPTKEKIINNRVINSNNIDNLTMKDSIKITNKLLSIKITNKLSSLKEMKVNSLVN